MTLSKNCFIVRVSKRFIRSRQGDNMTLFWHPSGPLMEYDYGILNIEDLNPEMKTSWRMSRWEMLTLGWRCFVAAISLRRS